jgi:thiol:disulfide interchange protein DsbA
MKKLLSNLMIIVALLYASGAQAELVMGKDYKMLNAPQPASTSKIEVLEFFFYECGHCFHLHPLLAAWEKTKTADVEMNYIPTMFRDSTEPLAHAYYALQSMGQILQLDDAIYQAIHVTQTNLYDADTIGAFVSKHGVDRAKFEATYNSFSVQSKVSHAKQMIRTYNIQGTPTLIVDGRYVITGLQPEDTVRVLNELIVKVRKDRASVGKNH